MSAESSTDVEALYTVNPLEFTRRRDELAARLRAAGRRDEAAAVRRMKRPSLPVWTVNALARDAPDGVRAFVDATDRLKRGQLGDRDAVTAATRTQRQALQVLMRSAEAILRRATVKPTAQTLQRISGTLVGAATDRDARRDLLHGRLTDERHAPGFEALDDAQIALLPARRAESPKPAGQPARITAERAREAQRAARARADDLAAAARALEETAAVRKRDAAEAGRALSALAQQVRQAEARARDLQQQARAAATAAKQARREAERAAAKRGR
jgi:hypothetical protein